MKEQLKAEAYVREQRPALIEYQKVNWVCGIGCDWFCNKCKAGESNVPSSSIPNALICPKCKSNGDFISLPINLQDWLGVLEDAKPGNSYYFQHGSLIYKPENKIVMDFSMETGQPSSPADYKAFNDIVSV